VEAALTSGELEPLGLALGAFRERELAHYAHEESVMMKKVKATA
jgi:hypothetical protein